MERAAVICEKMNFKGCFSLTKTATGILFKFSHPDDYQAVYKKGFHKITGARFYRKVRNLFKINIIIKADLYNFPIYLFDEHIFVYSLGHQLFHKLFHKIPSFKLNITNSKFFIFLFTIFLNIYCYVDFHLEEKE